MPGICDAINLLSLCIGLQTYLMVLHESKQHGDHHFLLCVQLLPCICFVRAPQDKQIMNYWLQGWDSYREKTDDTSVSGIRRLVMRITKTTIDNSTEKYF